MRRVSTSLGVLGLGAILSVLPARAQSSVTIYDVLRKAREALGFEESCGTTMGEASIYLQAAKGLRPIPEENQTPSAPQLAAKYLGGGNLEVQTTLVDPESDNVDLGVEHSEDGVNFSSAEILSKPADGYVTFPSGNSVTLTAINVPASAQFVRLTVSQLTPSGQPCPSKTSYASAEVTQ